MIVPEMILPQEHNANRHTPRGMGLLEASIGRDGWIGAITVARNGEAFDGSARVEVIGSNGMIEDATIIDIDGSSPIILRRVDIPTAEDPRAIRLGVGANRIALLNIDLDPALLLEVIEGGIDLSYLFFPEELTSLRLQSHIEELISSAPLEDGEPEEEKAGGSDVHICPRCGHVWG